MLQERHPCYKSEINATGRKSLLLERNSCYRKENNVTGSKFLLLEVISCYRMEIPVTGRKFLVKEEYFWNRKDFLHLKNFLLKWRYICCRNCFRNKAWTKLLDYIYTQFDPRKGKDGVVNCRGDCFQCF